MAMKAQSSLEISGSFSLELKEYPEYFKGLLW